MNVHKIIIIVILMQQHGSVYWKCGSEKILADLHPNQCMYDQLKVNRSLIFYGTSKNMSINLLLSEVTLITINAKFFFDIWDENSLSKNMSPNCHLSLFLQDTFSVPDSPIWMDSSTTKQCRNLETKLGGPQVNLTTIRQHR